ncbi:hypothetical protein PYW07_015098 [Mythimna separata]|uniref:Uncharacterized protein n=1 Tax=Mythimna separata TaxID=271217 RepID=A0AAD8DZ66_MYTSE|nr:hypothetical protein PYW07_015098 [Mythimna separata]
MIALLLLCGIIAGACAAPHFNEFPFKTPQRRPDFSNFDSSTSESQEGVEGTEYKITVPLYDFKPKDIVVKALEGLVKIQVTDKNQNTISTIETLPDTVNLHGTNWIIEHGVLKITFPLKDGVVVKTTDVAAVTEQQPELGGSREEIETNVNDVQDADVGLLMHSAEE